MAAIAAETMAAAAAAGWNKEELTEFAGALLAFRERLPVRQQAVFTDMLNRATASAAQEDARGYVLGPGIQPPALPRTLPPEQSPRVVIAIIAILLG